MPARILLIEDNAKTARIANLNVSDKIDPDIQKEILCRKF